jgi:chromosome segregation ATPase
MGILQRLFPAKTAITSETIKAEIDYSESEIKQLQAEIGPRLASIATMTDAEHVKMEADIAATKRAIKRLDARIAHLQSELPAIIESEKAAQAAAKDEALRKRAEGCRKMNTVESKKLLTDFDQLASQMGDVLARLKEIADETNSVNKALRENRVADSVVSYDSLYRKHSAGHYEFPFSAMVIPAAFSGGNAHWPRS